MSVGPVVSNTTPIITLAPLGAVDLRRKVYGVITIPTAVAAELRALAGSAGADVPGLSWVNVRASQSAADLELIVHLDAGEAEAIALAQEVRARAVLLDEHLARNMASSRGLAVIGTLAVMGEAKRPGHISAVRPLVTRLREVGAHVSPPLVEAFLRSQGE